MHRIVTKLRLRGSFILLAACMSGVVFAQAAEKPSQPGAVSGIPSKHLKDKKDAKTKKQDQKPKVDKKAEAKKQDKTDSASEIAQLKKQLALQQAQIAQLLQAVNKLQSVVAATSKPAMAVSVAEPSQNASAASHAKPATTLAASAASRRVPQFPSTGEVASLSPVVPGESGAVGSRSGSKIIRWISRVTSGAPQPAPPQAAKKEKLGPIATQNFKVGATFYGNFSHYTGTGYAPAFQDLVTTQLAPGNDGLNTFELTRGYINFFYTPNEHVTLRITPDIYRASDGSLTYRLKYGFVDFQNIFGNGVFKKTKLTFGQTTEPLIDWEEGLSSHRYTYLLPWNYLTLSSTYDGVKLHGPIMMDGKEYLDYDVGIFNSTSFHHVETNDRKSVMGRVTLYPFGTKADRTGLGFTVFDSYGYSNTLPTVASTAINTFSLLAHYQTHDKGYQIAFEYQLGHNAVSAGSMFSGVGPAGGSAFSTLAGTVLGGAHTRQQGFDVFGHARLGHSPFSLWGLYMNFQPNTNFQPSSAGLTNNPMDFARTVGGISYKVTDHMDVAFGDQNFHWVHPQGQTGPDTNAIVVWTEFNY
jgi:hypothetical protein